MARVAVMGAGLGGLAAAARLAALGHRVTVFEQAETVGGKLGWFARDGLPQPAQPPQPQPQPAQPTRTYQEPYSCSTNDTVASTAGAHRGCEPV